MFDRSRFSLPAALLLSAALLLITVFIALPASEKLSAGLNAAHAPVREAAGIAALAGNEVPSVPAQKSAAVPPLEEPAPEETRPPAEEGSWEPPADVLSAQADFLEQVKSKTALGEVRERFYVNDGATDVIGNVAVRNCTEEQRPDFAALLREGAPLDIPDKAEPTVLIFHTHTTESYLPAYTGAYYTKTAARSTDPANNMVRVGEAICKELEARGIGYIHDTAVYDETYNGAYARSRQTVLRLLEQYPGIRIVLDVHRDSMWFSDTVAGKPTAVIGGRKAAQIMIITGAEEGPVTDFPDWGLNLRFALSLQNAAQNAYPGLMKPVFFCRRRYNMDVVPCGLLLEFGSDTNTLEEALYSAHLFGTALAELIEAYA